MGLIEMVPGCTSLGKIQKTWKGAFKTSVISDWFRAQNAAPFDEIVKRFSTTLAGAICFEHVLGLGDRHCDNLLLKPDGTIFHIDFGCCFGRDYGVAWDAPFTLTEQMMDVLSDHRQEFIDNTVRAFLAVRRYHVFLTGLGMAALGCRLPHVQKVSDARVLLDRLDIRLVETEAENRFRELVNKALMMKKQQINDALHTFYMTNFYKAPGGK